MSYEFSEPQQAVIKGVAYRFRILGALFALIGASSLISGIAEIFNGQARLGTWALLLLAATQVATGVFFYRPGDNLLRIASSQGSDIAQLMTAFRELSMALKLTVGTGILGTILVMVSNLA